MQLRLARFVVEKIVAGSETKWENGVLSVDFEEVRRLVLQDRNFADVKVDLAAPGEKVRIVHVMDAVEPRVKVEGPSMCFPGFLGPAYTVGSGLTNCLAGAAVLGLSGDMAARSSAEPGVLEFNEGFIDMTGPAEKWCTCSDTHNVCVTYVKRGDCSMVEFDASARVMTLKVAVYLAKATVGQTPTEEDTYALGSVDEDLPRVAYINQIQSQGFLCRTFLYGAPMEGTFTATLLHPNESLDGAVVSSNFRSPLKAATYLQQTNPILMQLLKRHGKDLNFVGQIIGRGHFDDFPSKQRHAHYASKLAGLLGAQAAVLSIEGAGNANVDYMETVKALENAGIAAVPIVHEQGAGPNGDEQPLVYSVQEAVSIISGGIVDQVVDVPAVDRVIGGDSIWFVDGPLAYSLIDASKPFRASPQCFYCGFWQMQVSGIRALDY